MLRGWQLRKAVHLLHEGGIVAYPTESVYGLGCNPLDPFAVFRLLDLKQRPIHKGLILIADRFDVLAPWLEAIPSKQKKAALASWPGPHTWVWPAKPWVPTWIRGEHSTLAIRITKNSIARELCAAWGRPLVSTSANPSHLHPARSALKCQQYFRNQLDTVIHGPLDGLRNPTDIRDVLTGKTLRPA